MDLECFYYVSTVGKNTGFIFGSLHYCTFTNQRDEHSSADTLMSKNSKFPSGVILEGCSTNSLAAEKAGQSARLH